MKEASLLHGQRMYLSTDYDLVKICYYVYRFRKMDENIILTSTRCRRSATWRTRRNSEGVLLCAYLITEKQTRNADCCDLNTTKRVIEKRFRNVTRGTEHWLIRVSHSSSEAFIVIFAAIRFKWEIINFICSLDW